MKKTIALIFGGKSAEHEVSLRSAKNIATALDKDQYDFVLIGISKEGSWYRFPDMKVFDNVAIEDKAPPAHAEQVALMALQGKPTLYSLKNHTQTKIDCAFPILHGTMGEDGTIQGLFKMVQLPFVGCGVWSSAAGMDKEIMKRLLINAHIPTAKHILLTPEESHSYDYLVKNLGLPFFIKPANAGSSVGVHKIKNETDYVDQLKDAFQFDFKILAEEFVQGRELECSVIGLNDHPKASLPGEVIPTHDFYSYEAKYVDENGAQIQIPAKLDQDTIKRIQQMAEKTFHVMGCDGLTRVDFFMKANGDLVINEINTMPGFTKISMYPKMWEASGIAYKDLVSQLIQMAFKKHEKDASLKTTYL